jgi:hypothetical protein
MNRSDPEFFPYTVVSDLNTIQNQTFKDNRFNFAVGLFDPRTGKFSKIKPEFGNLEMLQMSLVGGK